MSPVELDCGAGVLPKCHSEGFIDSFLSRKTRFFITFLSSWKLHIIYFPDLMFCQASKIKTPDYVKSLRRLDTKVRRTFSYQYDFSVFPIFQTVLNSVTSAKESRVRDVVNPISHFFLRFLHPLCSSVAPFPTLALEKAISNLSKGWERIQKPPNICICSLDLEEARTVRY